jgi:hypothetical protein
MKCPDCGAVWYEDPPGGIKVFKCPLCGYPYQNDCCGMEERDRLDALLEEFKELRKEGEK